MLKNFEKGEVSDMIYAIDRWAEEERLKGIKIGEIKGEAKGEAKGEEKKAREIATKLLKKNMPLEEIEDITGLNQTEIEQIQTSLL